MTATAASTPSSAPRAGEPAPELSLRATNKATISLSDFRGKQPVLVAFFPLAFTSTCTEEMCAFRDDYDVFAEKGVAILPVSVDSTDSLRAYKEKYELKTEFLSDFKRDASRRWGVLLEDKFYSNRAYFLIDKDGIVRWAHVEAHPGLRRENAEILAEIAKLK